MDAPVEAKKTEENTESNFECGICAEVYKDAKILPCKHKFCGPCLSKLADESGSVTCPVCRRSHHFGASGGASRVTTKSFIKEWMHYFRKPDKKLSTTCEGCEEGECLKHCVDCGFDMCRRCAISHSRFPTSRLHVLVTLKEHRDSGNPHPVQPPLWCNSHPANHVEFFCDTCGVVICIKCTVLDHPRPEHSYRYLKDAAIEFSNELKEMVSHLNTKATEIRESQMSIKEALESLQRCYKGEKKKMNNHIHKLSHEVSCSIQQKGYTLLEELKDECDKHKVNLTARLKELEGAERDLYNAKECAEKLMHHGNSGQMMVAKSGITTHIESVLQAQTVVDQAERNFFEFQPCSNCSDINNIGKIHIAVQTDASECTNIPQVDVSSSGAGEKATLPDEGTPVDTVQTKHDDSVRGAELSQNSDGTWMLKVYGWMTENNEFLTPVKAIEEPSVDIKLIQPNTMIHRFGQKGDGLDELCNPWGLITTRDGHLLMCDHGNSRLQSFTKQGQHRCAVTFSDISTTIKPVFSARASDDTIFTTDHGSNQVVVHTENGKVVRCFGKGTLKCPFGIVISPVNGKVYVADHSNHCIHIFHQNGDALDSFGCEGNAKGQLQNPVGVAIDSDGKVFVSDSNNHRIQVYDAEGKFLYSFGCQGTRNGQMNCPAGIDLDQSGNVYVCDRYNNRVLKFDSKGTFISRIGSQDGMTNRPVSVCVTVNKPFADVIVVNNEDCSVQVFAQ
ncbi:E3 ubiquitin-protein ligase TRIM56-like [Glandiceps talaboti]